MLSTTSRVSVLIAGHDADRVRELEGHLGGQASLQPVARNLGSDVKDALVGVATLPGLLVVVCSPHDLTLLESLAARPAAQRPAMIICGDLGAGDGPRLAVRCGAADLLPARPAKQDFVDAVMKAALAPALSRAAREAGSITAVIGVAGGVGASFIATSLAHGAQQEAKAAVLVDLDLTYAPLTAYLGVKPDRSLKEAVDRADSLDEFALNGYVGRHRSGVGILAGGANAGDEFGHDSAERFRVLLQLIARTFDCTILDASRFLDPVSQIAMMDAQHVVMVMQQSIGNVHNAVRLYRALTRQLGIPRERVQVAINRFSRKAGVTSADIERALGSPAPIEVASEYELAQSTLDAASSLYERDRRSALTKAIADLGRQLYGTAEAATTTRRWPFKRT